MRNLELAQGDAELLDAALLTHLLALRAERTGGRCTAQDTAELKALERRCRELMLILTTGEK